MKEVLKRVESCRGFGLLMVFMGVLAAAPTENLNACDKPSDFKENGLITVFLDFPYHTQYIRESVTVLNYVRDRELSEIQIKITRHGAGLSGDNYIISLIGRQRFEGMNNEITFWAPDSNTRDETRRGLVDRIKLGLAPYLANTNLNGHVSLNINDSLFIEERQLVQDPWKNWTFEVYGGGNYYKESTQTRFNSRWGFYADKVSEDWKVRIRPYFNISERTYKTDDGDVVSENYRHGFDGFLIRSMGEHWSTGMFVDMLASSFHNMKFNIETSPGIEYSLFPYSEATKRSITLAYMMGGARNYYLEETIFLKEKESLFKQALKLSVNFEQPWGGIRSGVTGSHYFHDFDVNRLELFSRLDLQLLKGFSLNVRADLDLINDLLTLPASDSSLEEILLQERAQSTSYQVYTSVGLSYRFGSDFSNVVNTRF